MTDNVLNRTAEIVKNGWCKGNFQHNEKHCVMGAMATAMNYTYDFDEDVFYTPSGDMYSVDHVFDTTATKVLADTINEQYPGWKVWDAHDIFVFNDAKERTQGEIVAVLEKAAVKLEEQV